MTVPTSGLASAVDASRAQVNLPTDALYGLALRPPVMRWDGQRYQGSSLAQARLDQARAMTGVVGAVQLRNFLGVVAVTPLYARQAIASLAPQWLAPAQRPAAPSASGDAYSWQLAPKPAPPGAEVVVWCMNGQASVWLAPCSSPTQQALRAELALLLQLAPAALQFVPWAQAGESHAQAPLPLLDVLDAAADAALLSQAVGRPVRVACEAARWARQAAGSALRLSLAQPEPDDVQASAVLVSTSPGGAGDMAAAKAQGAVWQTDSAWAVRPSLARLLSAPEQARPLAYASAHAAGTVNTCADASELRHAGVDDLNAAQVFAQESLWHEQALAQGVQPLAWRLQHLPPGRGRSLAEQVLAQAQWPAPDQAQDMEPDSADRRLRGRGFATAQVQTQDECGAASMVWSAWVAQVAVDPQTGAIEVTHVVAGHDSQSLQPVQGAPLQQAIIGQDKNWLANARQLLLAPAVFDDWTGPDQAVALAPTGSKTSALVADSGGALRLRGQLELDGVATLPAAAAIANAIAQATGVRLREVPFQPAQLRQALNGPQSMGTGARLRQGWAWLAAGAASAAGLAAMAWPLKPALPLTAGPDVSLYSPQALERGRLVAAAGDCVVCHTAPGGVPNAGGLGLETPFGTIYSTNITPDQQSGIGRWSYTAFERAMRQGIHQDGRQLYPAFPYTAFAKLSDGDLQALYGYLMAQPAVQAQSPPTRLAFPYNLRVAMAGWNTLFHDATPFKPDPQRSPEWNRGAYLVEGAGHCAACHSPRNALGAEKSGKHYLAGGEAEGWTAPALNQLAAGPRPWGREELVQYLRSGFAPGHGVAAGPMAPVIQGLAQLPETDVQAMASYLLDLPGAAPLPLKKPPAADVVAPLPLALAGGPSPAPVYAQHAQGERIYQNACAVCHEVGNGPVLFGVKPQLGLNTSVHAATPANLIQVILHGIQEPADDALGYMPGFKDSLDDEQVLELISYLRERFSPEGDAWPKNTKMIKNMRQQTHKN